MSNSTRKMTPRQFYQVAVNGLGATRVADVLKIGVRSVQRWIADPTCTADDSQSSSQLERLHRLFERMDEVGLGYACRGAIRYLDSAVSEVCCPKRIAAPLDTMLEEQNLDYKRVADLHALIDAEAPVEEVQQAEREALEEISRTVARYIKDNE